MEKIIVDYGPEDMVLDLVSGTSPRLIVSCCERRPLHHKSGEIYAVSLDTHEPILLERVDDAEGTFKPHGIDLIKTGDKVFLYVISHTKKGLGTREQVRIYELKNDKLYLQDEPIENDEFLISPNDITALPDKSFYLTNDSGFHLPVLKDIDRLVGQRGSVVHYDHGNKSFKKVAVELNFANGIKHLPGNKLLVTELLNKELIVYSIGADGELAFDKWISVDEGLDNISLAEGSNVIIPAHTSLGKLVGHFVSTNKHSPSTVYKVNYETKEKIELFDTDGSHISGASTAIEYNGRLYISQIMDNYILVKDI